MATEGSNLHGGGRTDNRPAYSCHSRQKAGSILEEEPRRGDGRERAQQTAAAPILPPQPPLPAAFLRLPAWSPWQLTAASRLSVASDKANR